MNDPDFAASDHPDYPDRGWDESVRLFDERLDDLADQFERYEAFFVVLSGRSS